LIDLKKYCYSLQEICNNVIIKYPTTP